LVSHLFTPYDEALALLILENNCDGLKDIVANGALTDKKKKIITKYTCKRSFKKGGGAAINKQLNAQDIELPMDEVFTADRWNSLSVDITKEDDEFAKALRHVIDDEKFTT